MWILRTQFSKCGEYNPKKDELEWSEVHCATEEDAESWWQTRTQRGTHIHRAVATMFNPQGRVVRVKFL